MKTEISVFLYDKGDEYIMRLSESIPGKDLIWKGWAMAFYGAWLPLIVMLVGFSSATAKIPKGAQKALKTKYLHSRCEIQTASIPAGKTILKTKIITQGQTHVPMGQTLLLQLKPVKVNIIDGELKHGSLKNREDLDEFAEGNVVEVKKINFKKSYIEMQIQDPGKVVRGSRGTLLRIYFDQSVLDRGDVEEISGVIGTWLEVQDSQAKTGGTALIQASENGHEGIVQALLAKGAEINHQAKTGGTALIQASENGHEGIVQALLAKGAEINHQAKTGVTALIQASQNGHEGIVQVLLAGGAEINHQAKTGSTALYMASQNGHEGIVQALLAKGAEIDIQDGDGVTALIMAAYQGHEGIVKALLAKGANFELRENGGETALRYAKTQQIKQLLRAAGARR